MGNPEKQMQKNKAVWRTSGVACEKLESIFKMHACLNFSLLLCHCFEKSKLCLQKLNVCIHMYESIQLRGHETAEHNSRFCLETEVEANSKIHFLRKLGAGSFQHSLLRCFNRLMRNVKGLFHFSWNHLFPTIPLVQAAFISLLAYGLPTWSSVHQGFSKGAVLLPRGFLLLLS